MRAAGALAAPRAECGGLQRSQSAALPSQPPPQHRQPCLPACLQVMPDCSGTPPAASHTSYRQDYGRLGADPLSHTAAAPSHMTLAATSGDLAKGTARASLHPPGYCGHVPAAHPTGSCAAGASSRADPKTQALLFSLDQYSRGRVPQYTGELPAAAVHR